jgi:PAS domain-containing protein
VPLILSRELAANLSTPMFLIDAEGALVFCNEAAELMLGRSFAELGSVTANEFGTMLVLRGLDGEPLRRRDTPPGRAFLQREPAHHAVEDLVRGPQLPLRAAPGRPLPPVPPAGCGGAR